MNGSDVRKALNELKAFELILKLMESNGTDKSNVTEYDFLIDQYHNAMLKLQSDYYGDHKGDIVDDIDDLKVKYK